MLQKPTKIPPAAVQLLGDPVLEPALRRAGYLSIPLLMELFREHGSRLTDKCIIMHEVVACIYETNKVKHAAMHFHVYETFRDVQLLAELEVYENSSRCYTGKRIVSTYQFPPEYTRAVFGVPGSQYLNELLSQPNAESLRQTLRKRINDFFVKNILNSIEIVL